MSEVVTRAFAQENVKVRYKFSPWVRAIHDARIGYVAGSIGLLYTADRGKDFLFSEALITIKSVLFFRSNNTAPWFPIEKIKNRRLGLTRGYDYGDYWRKLTEPAVHNEIEMAVDDLTNLKKLAAGRIDGFICDPSVCWSLIKQNWPKEQHQQFRESPNPQTGLPIYLVINRQDPNATELIRRFNLGLQKLKRSGVWRTLTEREQ
ncbi:substrate-binding periplasmic protein [Iodobacter ciconiae]|uniref:substrate-binding periplasmic protein n=1 Tax=Iodobacter ciconiae TaxID=2496266 RepID=UPI001F43B5EA|nr:transporter substrate-binding domain-containing protein [Iodobacter ciconiae]